MRAPDKRKQPSLANASGFRKALAVWFKTHGRDLPWRRTQDPYAILVSEFMLQQTPVATVTRYYNEWLRRFPSLAALARAGEREVLQAWEGLGYYARGQNLHRCAKRIIRDLGGKVPRAPVELRSLPGIGPYTANAIAVFAFDQSLPIVETNTARVLSRVFNIRDRIDSTRGRAELWNASARLVPARGARSFQTAMMDLGVITCSSANPQCRACPVQRYCRCTDPQSLPKKRKPPAKVALTETHSFASRRGAVLLQRCQNRWTGMWMLPPTAGRTTVPIYTAKFPFTRHVVTLRVVRGRPIYVKDGQRWFPISRLTKTPIPSPHRRALENLLGATQAAQTRPQPFNVIGMPTSGVVPEPNLG
jgi:A/G-specific DNA glycosylase